MEHVEKIKVGNDVYVGGTGINSSNAKYSGHSPDVQYPLASPCPRGSAAPLNNLGRPFVS